MKRTALTLVLVLILSLILTSCQYIGSITPSLPGVDNESKPKPDPTSEDELMERVSDTMDALESCKSKSSIKFEHTIAGTSISLTASSSSIYINTPGEEYYYTHTDSRTTSGTLDEITNETVAYDSGEIYLENTYTSINDNSALNNHVDSYTSKIYSDISLENYRDLYEDSNLDIFLSDALNAAFSKQFKKNDDSTWTLEYSKLPKSFVKELADKIGFSKIVFGTALDDVSMKFDIDSDFHATSMTARFYTDSAVSPIMTIKTDYSNFNSAVKNNFDKSTYVRVDDAGIVKKTCDYVNNFIDNEHGTAIISSTYSDAPIGSATTSTSKYKETNNISFQNVNDTFSFSANASVNGQEMLLEYSGGTLSATSGGNSGEMPMTDYEAYAYLSQIIAKTSFTAYDVKSVKKISEDHYRIDCALSDVSKFFSGVKYGYNLTFYYIVKFDGDEVTSISCNLSFYGTTSAQPYPYVDSTPYYYATEIYFNPKNN